MTKQEAGKCESIRFGEAEWDAGSRRLVVRDSAVKLPWRSAECLHLLAEARGAVVAREEFFERVWGGAVMEDSNLAHAIAGLRKALDPAPDGGSYITTVAKVGYRLAVAVERLPVEQPRDAQVAKAASRTVQWRWRAAAALGLIAILAVAYWRIERDQRIGLADEKVAEAMVLVRRGIPADGNRAMPLLEAALRLVPEYPPARAGIAEIAARYGKSGSEASAEGAARLAREAWEADRSCTECEAILGFILMARRWEWQEAGERLRSAARAQPLEPQWHLWYGQWLAVMGRFEEALEEARMAIRLNPSRPQSYTLLAAIHYFATEYDEAARAALDGTNLDNQHSPGHQWLQRIYMMQNDPVAMIEARHAAVSSWSDEFTGHHVAFRKKLIDCLAREGKAGVVRELLAEVGQGVEREANRYNRASWYSWMGDQEAAVAELEAAVRARNFNVIYAAVDPAFAGLRGHPRFQAVITEIGIGGKAGTAPKTVAGVR